MRSRAVRRDIAKLGVLETPRHLSAIGALDMQEAGSVIPQLLLDERFRLFASGIFGTEVVPYADHHENVAVVILHEFGDHHGGHCDDFYGVINIAVSMPDEEAGGVLHYAPRATTREALEESRSFLPLQPGDAYAMESGNTVHEVTELFDNTRERIIVSLSWSLPGQENAPSYSGAPLFGRKTC